MKILLIIPAYNEEKNILRVVNTIKENRPDLDYIVIDDGSQDSTLSILKENNIPHIHLIHNLGIGGAVQTGYKYAYEHGYDIAVQFDGDGQHDINCVSKICEPIIKDGLNMCIGTRFLDKSSSEFQSTRMRRFGKNIISMLIKHFTKQKITDPTSGFRAVDKNIISLFANQYPTEYPEPESNLEVLLKQYRVTEVPVSMHERTGGKSFVTAFTSIDYMLKVTLAILIDSIQLKKEKRRDKNVNKS